MPTPSSESSAEVLTPIKMLLAPDAGLVTIQNASRCPVCLNLDLKHTEGTSSVIFLQPLKEFQKASRSGCVYCTIICNTGKLHDFKIRSSQKEICLHTDHMGPHSIRFDWRWPHTSRDKRFEIAYDARDIRLQLSLYPEAEPLGRFNKSKTIPRSARSVESMDFCKERLQECLTSHPKCQREQGLVPTRLLFLGDGLRPMKIVEPCKMELYQYAALSHRWGTSRSLELKEDNEALMKHSIPWDLFPQTYRDAVSVCQELKIGYLWIDSMCIKQDDKHDWNREAAKMADIFENALIVIAASCCWSTEDSFMNSRAPKNCGPVVIAWTDDKQPKPLLQVQKCPSTGIHMLQETGICEPLDTRAWGFQERRLAHRFLSFTSEEVQWSCKAALSCECPKAWHNSISRALPEDSPHLIPTTTDEWKQAITEFSGLNLTFQSDRLPALSGLAARFQQKHNINYLAGLWLNDKFIEQLTWCSDSSQTGQDNEYDLAYRAPTFSWASSNTKVVWFPAGRTDSYIDILETKCTLASQNPFGEVHDGYLRVRGGVVRAMLQQPPSRDAEPYLRLADGEVMRLSLYLDKGTGQNYFLKVAEQPESKIHLGRSLRWSTEATGDLLESVSVFCLRICVHGLYEYDHFLVLIKSSRVPGAYERIGQVCSRGIFTEKDEQEQFRKVLELWESAPTEELKIV